MNKQKVMHFQCGDLDLGSISYDEIAKMQKEAAAEAGLTVDEWFKQQRALVTDNTLLEQFAAELLAKQTLNEEK